MCPSPAVGAAISLLELACTGQVYAPTILYMLQAGEGRAAGYLALYNLAFIVQGGVITGVLAVLISDGFQAVARQAAKRRGARPQTET